MRDKISIIVPIYNVELYLKRCIDSLLKQTYKNIEILLIDDCSTDLSANIAKEYADNFPYICYFIQREKNGGLSAARNTGIKASTGKWLAFVDSDDWVDKNYIFTMYKDGVKNDSDIVINSSYYIVYDKKKVIHSISSVKTNSSHKEKIALLRFSSTSKLIKKELFIKYNVKFPEDIWRCEDISTIVPLFTMTKKISIINQPMYYYFQRSTSLSNQNYKNADISFYPKTILRMLKFSISGFEKELEFRAISELMYGMVMIMIRSERSNKEICKYINRFNKKFPKWKKNPYLSYLPKGKRIFIFCTDKKQIILLKMLIKFWDIKIKVINWI